MSTRRTGNLSQHAYGLVEVADELGKKLPLVVSKYANAVRKAMLNQQPRVALNRSFGALRRHNPASLAALCSWLQSPEVRRAFTSLGLVTGWHTWVTACERMDSGMLAATALHCPKGGRPRAASFSPAHDAAILAADLQRNGGLGYQEALNHAAEQLSHARDVNLSEPDQRAVRKRLANAKRVHGEDLAEQAALIRRKASTRRGKPGGL